ncbi:undecaprenyldiphospho-muramoylpentapeptide beta-N-acetylglucosaminyltransferase [bacterium]|nr:undecaprenyldiphospho-muramoylpentapeptide beta-N-acetylglucosaminyltransferase [bacterium]
MKIVFTGGGTGGHIYPIIAVSREVKRICSEEGINIKFIYIGPKDELTSRLLSQEGIKIKPIIAGKIRRYGGIVPIIQNIIDIFKIIIGIIQAFNYMFFLAPDLIFSKGGYGAFPVILSAKILKIPVILHESDAISGIANKLASKFAVEVFVSFPETENIDVSKMILVGNPIRKEILRGSKEDAKELFEITTAKPVLLIMGGSQGAQKINDLILDALPQLAGEFEIIHQTGIKNFEQVKAEANVMLKKDFRRYYHIYPFLREIELKHAYAIADIVVARAGSGTIFEIAALGKPSILIPLPHSAQSHQLKNAYEYAKTKAAIVIEQGNLTPSFFIGILKNIISNPEKIKKMQEAAKEFSKPRAAEVIAHYIVDYFKE